MEALISVVVPIYKVEQYLRGCAESICKQTYQNIEVLLIDDGSPDRSGEIAEELAKEDSRIRVIHKENGGLSDARNVGISLASGEYITFVDSDDTIHPEMLNCMLTALQAENCDIACCRYVEHYEDEKPAYRDTANLPVQILNSTEALKRLFIAKTGQEVVACCKLYKKSLFSEDIRFPKGKLHEDNFTTYRLIARSEKVCYLDRDFYFYLQRRQSITGSFHLKRLDAVEAVEEAAAFVRANNLPLTKELNYYYLHTHIQLIRSMILAGMEADPARKTLEKNLFNKAYHLFTNPYFSKKTLLLLAIYKYGGFSIYRSYVLRTQKGH